MEETDLGKDVWRSASQISGELSVTTCGHKKTPTLPVGRLATLEKANEEITLKSTSVLTLVPFLGSMALSGSDPDNTYGQGVGLIHLTNLDCTGDEGSLFSCDSRVDTSACTHSQDAAVICEPRRM